MTETELAYFRRRLLALKKRLGGDLSALEEEALRRTGGEAAGNLSNLPIHQADLGTDTYEEELSVALLENVSATLRDIDDALTRIDNGTFGRCEECGRDIPRERLQTLPYTRYCVDDAQKFQRPIRE